VVILRTLACFVLCFGTPAAAARPVDLALVLAVDASRSIDDEEYRIQREGYATAFESRAVIEAIESGTIGAIAVTYVEWSGSGRQRQLVPWAIVSDPDTALAFAEAIRRAPRTFADFTAIGSAIDFSAQLLEDGAFATPRRTIDISGDGVSNAGPGAAELVISTHRATEEDLANTVADLRGADAVLGVVQQARFDAIKTNRPIVIVLDAAAGEVAVRRATTSGAIDCSAGATQPVRTLSLGEYRAVSLSGSVEAFVWLPSGQPRECTGGRLASTVEMTLSSGDSTRTVAVTGGGEVVLQ